MKRLVGVLLMVGAPWFAYAGGGPLNVLVVANRNHPESLGLARYYAQARGIPDRQILEVAVDPSAQSIGAEDFQRHLADAIQAHVEAQRLAQQITFVVLCRGLPSRVNDREGITSALTWGFKNAAAGLPCNLAANGFNPDWASERACAPGGRRIATLLTGRTLAEAKALVDRCVAAGKTPVPGGYVLTAGQDPQRDGRYRLFDNLYFNMRFLPAFPAPELVWGANALKAGALMGLQVGGAQFVLPSGVTLRPGALADNMTSFAGLIPENAVPGSQFAVLDWIAMGASATCGPVSEPCNFLEKFADPMVFFWYARGFNAAESYAMAMRAPYQSIVVADPLTAPYAPSPRVRLRRLPSEREGVIVMEAEALPAQEGAPPPAALDLYVDGIFQRTVTRVPPARGNWLCFAMGETKCRHTVMEGETLYDAVEGLAYMINTTPAMPVQAMAHGDRIELVYADAGTGGGRAYRAWTEPGVGKELTVYGRGLTETLLETEGVAREDILLATRDAAGARSDDVIHCKIVLADGRAVVLSLHAVEGEISESLLTRMAQQINAHPLLQGPDGVSARPEAKILALSARGPGPAGNKLAVDFKVESPSGSLPVSFSFADHFNDHLRAGIVKMPQYTASARGQILFGSGRIPLIARVELSAGALGPGRHTIRIVAREGSAVEAQGWAEMDVEGE